MLAAVVLVLVLDRQRSVDVTSTPRPDRGERAVLASGALKELDRAVASGRVLDGEHAAVSTATANARPLRVSDFTVRYVDEDPGALSAGSDAWVAAVDTTWAFRGLDRGVARTEVSFTFRQEGDHASIVGIGGNGRRTPLWLAGRVTVRRGPGVLVLAAGGDEQATRYLELASRAANVVRRVEPLWRDGLIVEVPGSADELDEELDAEPGEYAQIAAVTTTVDGSVLPRSPAHIFVNPEVFAPLEQRGAQVVMSHEATHVATGAATTAMPAWLVEGFADYVALRDVDLPLSVSAAQIAAQVRQHGAPTALPADTEFDTGATHLGASYQAAWLACRTLVRMGSEKELVAFYDAVNAGVSEPVAVRRSFGFSEASFIRSWRTRLQHLAR